MLTENGRRRRGLPGVVHAAWMVVVVTALSGAPSPASPGSETLLVTNFASRHVTFVDTVRGPVAQVEVGMAPWGVAVARDGLAYVSTSAGVAIVDVRTRSRLGVIWYRAFEGARGGNRQTGEYRPGGMGIAASPDATRVYVAVHVPDGPSRLEIIDTRRRAVIASVPVGLRPFDVVVAADAGSAYTIDHDSFTVTAIDTRTLRARTFEVAPLGRGAFDKPHYAALGSDGSLWLPVQGRALVRLEPSTGRLTSAMLTADTHQHGVVFAPDRRRLLIAGTGQAGGTTRGPSLTVYDTGGGAERVWPLEKPHERVAVSHDGRRAFLTGGYLLGGWDGLSIVDLRDGSVREIAVPDRPLGVVVLP
ncbi:MAG: YncE family protein [Armatimonadota bacterium]